jgi:hypothetical protein
MERLSFALLCGLALSALDALLLNGPAWIARPALIALFPGGFIASVLFHSDSPLLLVTITAFVYSGLCYVLFSIKRDLGPSSLRLAAIRMVIPVALLVVAACIPTLDPLFPEGLTELKRQESALQNDLPEKMMIEDARAVLRSKKIQFNEFEPYPGLVFQRGNAAMTASAGDRLIHSRFSTNAREFPCGYDMEIDLLFDASGKLNQRYIHRFRMCP